MARPRRLRMEPVSDELAAHPRPWVGCAVLGLVAGDIVELRQHRCRSPLGHLWSRCNHGRVSGEEVARPGVARGVAGAWHRGVSQLTGIYGDRLQRVTSVMTGSLMVPLRHVG